MINNFLNQENLNILLSISITVLLYVIFYYIYKKYHYILLHPNIVSMIIITLVLLITPIPYEAYKGGGHIILKLLGPIIVILAVPLYQSLSILLKNFRLIIIGSLLSVHISFFIMFILGKVFNIPKHILFVLIPRSISSPFGYESSKLIYNLSHFNMLGVTLVSITTTGILGAIFVKQYIKVFKIKTDVSKGISIGCLSHLMGTTQALEISPTVGAISTISIPITGIITILSLPYFTFIITKFY